MEKVAGQHYLEYLRQQAVLTPLGTFGIGSDIHGSVGAAGDPGHSAGRGPSYQCARCGFVPNVYRGGCSGPAASAGAMMQFIHVNKGRGNGPRSEYSVSSFEWVRLGSTPAGSSPLAASRSRSGGIDWLGFTRDWLARTNQPLNNSWAEY